LTLTYKSIKIAKDYLSINIGWAIGTALGVWVSGGISGGHINPAVSYLSLSVFIIH
jgi:aquaglyceroporin related protein